MAVREANRSRGASQVRSFLGSQVRAFLGRQIKAKANRFGGKSVEGIDG